ncbi:MAG: DNA primase [Parvularculaceae bacterium]
MPRFTPDFLDELKARLRPSDIIGRRLKLKKQGNEWVALSPFTKEKTPSFYVNDQKGFYHCFSSGKHGDIISFLQEVENLSFAEAVTLLAEQAGLPIPEDRPGDQERSEKRVGLIEAHNAATVFFQSMLRRAQGRGAAEYLQGRGVTEDQIEEFRIGFAPSERTALKDYLINKGYAEDTLVESGLLIRPEGGGVTYDRFRNRVMFPIFGGRDNVIAFGGRALEADARAKYLNSPETPLFHKGGVLYNHNAARIAAAKDKTALIVCEGYMDVVAMWGAGFRAAVAPLGTALTENQLALLWRTSDEPILCFDGDRAGLGAAYRAIDRALPLLKPGKSLRFAFLPQGMDPDDLIRTSGGGALGDVLEKAQSLVSVLWRREIEEKPLDTPERRAALRAGLRALIKGIADADVRNAYGVEFANRLQDMFSARPQRARPGGDGRFERGRGRANQPGGRNPFRAPARASSALKARGGPSSFSREATLVLAAVNHPGLIHRQEEAFLALDLADPALQGLLSALLAALLADPGLDSEGVKSHLLNTPAAQTLQRVQSDDTLNRQKFLRPGAELDEVEWGWSDALRHHLLATAAQREMSETAAQAFNDGEESWKAAVTAREELVNSGRMAERPRSEDETAGNLDDRLERMRASINARRRDGFRK